jgi:hypothetical protein
VEVRLQFGTGEDERHLSFRLVGRSWSARSKAIWEAIDRWADQPERG